MSDYKKYQCMECEHIYDEAKVIVNAGFDESTIVRNHIAKYKNQEQ